MVIAVIPSRLHSSRFPGKALISVAGEPLVVRVARQVAESGVVDRLLVATDHQVIAQAVRAAGFEAWLSDAPYRSGSDRVAAAVAGLPGERLLNVQGDEALIGRELLEQALAALDLADLGTVAAPLDPALRQDPDTVKVLLDDKDRAGQGGWPAGQTFLARDFTREAPGEAVPCLAHLGIYSFTRRALARFCALPSGKREVRESLEQLRALEHGLQIGVRLVQAPLAAVNRPRDLERLAALLASSRMRRPVN